MFCIFLAYTIDISKLSSPVTPFSVSQGFFHSVPRPKANLILLFIKQLGPSNRRLSTITTSNWTPLAQGLTLGNSSLPCPGPRAVLFITLLNIVTVVCCHGKSSSATHAENVNYLKLVVCVVQQMLLFPQKFKTLMLIYEGAYHTV